MSQPFYKTYSWFIPISVLTGIIIWMQAMPPPGGTVGSSSSGAGSKSLTRDDIHAFVGSEIRGQLLNTAAMTSGLSSGNYPPVKAISESDRLRILVTGGSGFVGSHLVDRLMMAGHQVTVVDNMFTGRKKNIVQWIGHPNFSLIIHDVIEPIMMEGNYPNTLIYPSFIIQS